MENDRKFFIDKERQMRIHLMLNCGGLGDIIHTVPALNYLFKNYPWQKYKIWVPDYLIELFTNMFPGQNIGGFSRAPSTADGVNTGILSFNTQRHSSIHIHLTDYAFYILTDSLPKNDNDKNLPYFDFKYNIKSFKLPEKYVCVSPFFRSALRQFPPTTLNEISDFIKGTEYKLVVLGSNNQVFNREKNIKTDGVLNWVPKGDHIINLSNKTTIMQSLGILNGAKALVTLDGGLLHLCSLTKTPIIAGFTSVDPCSRIPYRDGKLDENIKVITPEVDCKFCQTNWCMVYKGQHEFNKCFFKDLQCVKEMTSNKFIKHLKEIL